MSKNAKRRLKEYQINQTAKDADVHRQNLARVLELTKKAQETDEGSLDDIVLDLKSSEASAINNGGASEQIAYIIEEMGEEAGINTIEEALQ
jgi:hypothetical protein